MFSAFYRIEAVKSGGTHKGKKTPVNLRPLYSLFSFFSNNFTEWNCRLSEDSNSGCQSRRRASWPLDHTTSQFTLTLGVKVLQYFSLKFFMNTKAAENSSCCYIASGNTACVHNSLKSRLKLLLWAIAIFVSSYLFLCLWIDNNFAKNTNILKNELIIILENLTRTWQLCSTFLQYTKTHNSIT